MVIKCNYFLKISLKRSQYLGVNAGVVRHVAAALEASSSARGRSKIVSIGIAAWGMLKEQADLIGQVSWSSSLSEEVYFKGIKKSICDNDYIRIKKTYFRMWWSPIIPTLIQQKGDYL